MRYIINGHVKCKVVFLRNISFKIYGKNIKVKIGSGSLLSNCIFYSRGNNISITIIDGKNLIKNTTFYCEDNDSCIFIDRYLTMEGGHIASTE